jgi:hypothetical protein
MTQKFAGVYSQQLEKKQPAWRSLKIFNGFLVLMIVVGSLYYVTGINDLVVKGFELQELKVKVSNLAEENKKANIETTALKSYNNLAKRIENLNMVAVDNIDYIKADSGVALARQ